MTDLPSGWVYMPLRDLGVWYGGGTPSKSRLEFWEGGKTPWLTPKDMGSEIISHTRDHISQAAIEKTTVRVVPANSVALVVRSGILERKLPIGFVPFSTTLNQDMKAIVPLGGIDSRWLAWALRALEQRILRDFRKAGTTVASLEWAKLMTLEVPVPPSDEQQRIVVALEGHLSRLDAAQRQVSTSLARTSILRGRIFDSAVLAGLSDTTPDEVSAASHEKLSGRSGNRIDYKQLPALPSEWYWRVASDVCERIACGGTPEAHLMYERAGQVPFLKVYNVTKNGRVDFGVRPTFIDRDTHEGRLGRSRVRPGDVLTNIVGPPLGKSAVVPDLYPEWNINQAIVAFRASGEVLPAWLAIVLRSPYILQLLKRTARATAGQFNISLSTCRELPIPSPPIKTQRILVDSVARLTGSLDVVEKEMRAAFGWADRLRSALLSEALGGRLAEQNPQDEPAHVMLEPILAMRSTGQSSKRRIVRSNKVAISGHIEASQVAGNGSDPAPTTPLTGDPVQETLL